MAISLGTVKADVTIKEYPAYLANNGAVRVYNGSTAYSFGSSTFQSYMIRIGAVESTASRTLNQYYTVLNITSGAGILGSIIMGPPESASASRALTIKTTIDGIATEKVVTVGEAQYNNIVVGPIGAQGFASSSFSDMIMGKNNYQFTNDNTTRDDIIKTTQYVSIVSPDTLQGLGAPVIKFNSSCKVEIKENQAGRSDTYYRDHYALYLITG